jgi:hypothetical protein
MSVAHPPESVLPNLRQAIIDRADVAELAREAGFRKGRGKNWHCPFHGEDKRPSASLHKGRVHCFVCGRSWSPIDLAMTATGADFRGAVLLLAERYQIPWSEGPVSDSDRRRWAAEQARDRADLPAARAWRRATIDLLNSLLDQLKCALFDPSMPEPRPAEIQDLARWRQTLMQAGPGVLLLEYRNFSEKQPEVTGALVYAGRRANAAIRRAVKRILAELESAA